MYLMYLQMSILIILTIKVYLVLSVCLCFQLRVMEQQLAAVNWKPDDFEKHIRDLEQICRDKDRQINELQAHVEEQVSESYGPRRMLWPLQVVMVMKVMALMECWNVMTFELSWPS